jgi:hypothetical protein
MRQKVIISLIVVLFLAALGLLFVVECAYGGGMGAAYRSCDCLGIEWEQYDRTAADGPRRTLCIGIVRSRECYQFIGGPRVECDGGSQLTVETDKRVYEVGEDIRITIRNGLSSPASYGGLCSLRACQYLEGDWLCEMKECYGATVVLKAGGSTEIRIQAKDLVGARLKYRFEYQMASEGTLHTASSNGFTVAQKSETYVGHSFYVRQLIPGEAWLEDGTSRYFESPTSPERVELQGNALSLNVRVGRSGAVGVTRGIRFTIEPLGEDAVQVDCPEANIEVELEQRLEEAVNDAIGAYVPVTVPKQQWVGIFTHDTHNAPKWQLWWGDRPPEQSNQKTMLPEDDG